ncbi:MAG: hypothetical protein J7577_13350 [Sphingobacteriaceae bacterium]|nr:hypothetical protein [Sphingobacteriaceae bacterium]
MATKEPELLSKNAYAQYLGINEKAVRNAIAQGKIKKGFDTVKQKVIKHLADKEFGFQHKIAKPRAGVSKDKLADRLKSEKSPNKTDKNSDKSEPKLKKSKSPNKSEVLDEETAVQVLSFGPEMSVKDLIKSITVTPDMEYSESMRVRELIALAFDKIKLEEQEKTIVRRADVERVLFTFGTQIKKALMSIPARVADELVNADSKVDVINILTEEFTRTLTDFANFESIDLTKE